MHNQAGGYKVMPRDGREVVQIPMSKICKHPHPEDHPLYRPLSRQPNAHFLPWRVGSSARWQIRLEFLAGSIYPRVGRHLLVSGSWEARSQGSMLRVTSAISSRIFVEESCFRRSCPVAFYRAGTVKRHRLSAPGLQVRPSPRGAHAGSVTNTRTFMH